MKRWRVTTVLSNDERVVRAHTFDVTRTGDLVFFVNDNVVHCFAQGSWKECALMSHPYVDASTSATR